MSISYTSKTSIFYLFLYIYENTSIEYDQMSLITPLLFMNSCEPVTRSSQVRRFPDVDMCEDIY